jgi:hypothetical protein
MVLILIHVSLCGQKWYLSQVNIDDPLLAKFEIEVLIIMVLFCIFTHLHFKE